MSILSKFNNVKVSNKGRIPNNLQEKIDGLTTSYKKALNNNLSMFDVIDAHQLEHQMASMERFNNSNVSKSDLCKTIMKTVSSLHYYYISSVLYELNDAFNTTLDNKDFKIHGISSETMSNQLYFDGCNGNRLSWEQIRNLELNSEILIDFVFDKVGGVSIEDARLNECKDVFNDLYSDDTYRSIPTLAKNGTLKLPSVLPAVSSYTSRFKDGNTKTLKAIYTAFNELYSQTGNQVPMSEESFIAHFRLGQGEWTVTKDILKRYDRVDLGECVTYFKYFKNGALNIKFKNHATALQFKSITNLNIK